MLTQRTTTCSDCSSIQTLINEIDCRLAQHASTLYGNLVFMLNKPVPAAAIIDLLNYKRILQWKNINPDYASKYTVRMIASKVKLLKFK